MNDREEELTEQERYRPNIHLTLNLPICRMMQEGSLCIHNAEGLSHCRGCLRLCPRQAVGLR